MVFNRSTVVSEGRAKEYVPGNPMANSQGYALRARLIMSKIVGRPLGSDECVHHVNGDPLDDQPENLLLVDRGAHRLLHAKEEAASQGYDLETQKRCPRCKTVKSRSEFSTRINRLGLRVGTGPCKPCHAAYQARRRESHV